MSEQSAKKDNTPTGHPEQSAPDNIPEENNGDKKENVKKDEQKQLMDAYRERINKPGSGM